MGVQGRIHSFESFGTVDGPGIRFVVFMQGCPFCCMYCHNPDTWSYEEGSFHTAEEVFKKIKRFTPYFKNTGGGVTVSGGEPLMQIDFLVELFRCCKEEVIHTAIDTNGFHQTSSSNLDALLKYTDMVLLDIKHMNPEKHKKITGFSNNQVLDFAKYLNLKNVPTWIRYVVVPGLTDDEQGIKDLDSFIKGLSNIEKIELLPFHKMGEHKWKELGRIYNLSDTPPASASHMERVKMLFDCDIDISYST
ncbi:MAG: pyruvate formate-lyase-activating protein [Bacillota bacterium]